MQPSKSLIKSFIPIAATTLFFFSFLFFGFLFYGITWKVRLQICFRVTNTAKIPLPILQTRCLQVNYSSMVYLEFYRHVKG